MDEDKKWKILIVDDEKTNLDILNHILSEHYIVYIAKSGESALKKAKENHPDLILLDIVMPGMDGFEVIDHLKNDDETRKIPTIFITGLNDASNEEKGIRLGAVDYIPKPFDPIAVLTKIRMQLTIP